MTSHERSFGAGLMLVSCLVVSGCPGGGQPTPTTLASPKCPEHLDDWTVVDSLGEAFKVTDVPGTGGLAGVPEVNDCQRLIRNGGSPDRTYGPLAAVFASRQLDSLFTGRGGVSGGAARAAATIFVWPDQNDFGYSPLLLPPGWSCLYIIREGRGRDWRYHARIMPVPGHRFEMCTAPPDPERTYPTRLEVVARPLATFGELDGEDLRLSAARWDDDFVRGGRSQHVSLRCGDAWCDVLPTDATDAVTYTPPSDLPSNARISLPGWYDRQLLAVEDHAHPGTLKPGAHHVAYFPVKGLGTLAPAAFEGRVAVTGFVVLDAPNPIYQEKLGFRPGVNRIGLMRGSFPGAPGGSPPACESSDDQDKHDSDPWWGQVAPAGGGEPRTFCSYRHVHTPAPGEPMDGIVRWRWLETDEKTWQRCPTGCCPIS